ncbi:PIN domain-containing protein [Methylomonas rivi]|uniref:PIN domain-containing protein n=1 Tax=Methylomonas rivi TaxID=2952226 RepID=A0ABT1U6F5_9GAMM|nr:PIN domain-containing protein [Methylomonas sp. WSC-6]MBS4050390.1 PIN domain-containing protein [Methylomonas sp.]MCQ8129427.1 PIN domain-containing protein [Methylomonas sp. WSC-6]
MSVNCFVDSNVWLYAFMDESSPKHQQALTVIAQPGVMLSTQVVNEVCNNLLRKAGYTEQEIRQTVENFRQRYPIHTVTVDEVCQASALRESFSLSYWDSLVVASAIMADCRIIYSEDMHNGLAISGLQIINPFA